MKLYPFRASALVGLDIQPDALRLIQLQKTRRGPILLQAGSAVLPPDMSAEGRIKRWDVLHTLLAELVDALGLLKQYAAICLPANRVHMQRITVPLGFNDDEVEAEVVLHMQQNMPGLNEPLCVDFTRFPASEPAYQEIMFVAVYEACLMQYVECIEAAGLIVKIVDVDCYALRRALGFNRSSSREEAHVVLHVKKAQTELMIFDQVEMLFHQNWATSDMGNCLAQLKDGLQIFSATYRQYRLNLFSVCSDKKMAQQIQEALVDIVPCKIILPTAIPYVRAASQASEQLLLSQPTEFMVAYGAAMQDVPPW